MSNPEAPAAENKINLRERAPLFLGDSYKAYKSLISDMPLKLLEMRGKISDFAFDKLIEADIQRTFIFSPPIPGKFSFNSREFTKQIARQVEGMAYFRLIAERMIDHNPEIPSERILKYFNIFADKYQLPVNKLDEYQKRIHYFNYYRNEIKRTRDLYPNDKDLVAAIFTDVSEIPDDVKIETTPYCIVIYTAPENIIKFSHNPNTAGFFTIRDTTIDYMTSYHDTPFIVVPFVTDNESAKIFTHEYQHAKNNIFMTDKKFQIPLDYYDEVHSISPFNLSQIMKSFEQRSKHLDEISKYQTRLSMYILLLKLETDPAKLKILEEQKANIEGFLESKKLNLENLLASKAQEIQRFKKIISLKTQSYFYDSMNSSKDELIAMLKDGESDYFELLGKSNSYGYRMVEIENLIHELEENNLHEFAIQVKYWQSKYFENIKKSVGSFNTLMELGGYSREEAVAVLSSIPILLWSRTVKRLIAAKL